MSTLDSSSINISEMSAEQRLDFERKLEDEYVSGEFTWNSKKQEIIRAWADSLSHSIFPESIICQHIKKRLRFRGVSEGSIDYVAECLIGDYARYKDPKFDTYSQRDGNPSQRPSIFEDFEDLAKETLTPDQLEERSSAEQYEIITKEIKLIKSFKTKMSDRVELLETFAKKNDVRIPEFEKESSDIPPNDFWGQSELCYDLEGLENEINKLCKSVHDVKETVWYFRPTPEVAAYCSKKLQEFKARDWDKLRLAIMVQVKAIQNVLNPVSDGKWGALLDGWLKIGYDQKVNCGSHGSGVTNSIETGEYVLKQYRDGRKEIVGLKREFTREQVGDKTERDLLRLARIAVGKDSLQTALSHWIENTNLVEMMRNG